MRWFNRFIQMPLFDPDDAGGSGGVADDGANADTTDDGGDVDAGDGDDTATDGDGADGEHADDADGHEGSHGNDDDDDADLDAADDESRPLEERFKALKKSNNKLRKRFSKAWPVAKKLKELGITDVNDIVVGSRNWNALLERVGGDRNKLNRLLDSLEGEDLGGRDSGKAGRARGQRDADESDFDEKALEPLWDTTTATGKHFVQQARLVHEQAKTIKALTARVDSLEGGIRTEKVETVKQSWLNVINRDAKKIKDPDIREIYEDRMKSAFFIGQAQNKRLDPETLSTATLKKLKIAPTTTRIATAAGQSRMAATNAGRPRHMAGGGPGTPAKAKRETVDDVNRRIRQLNRPA